MFSIFRKTLVQLTLVIASACALQAQVDLVHHYTMDDCSLEDQLGSANGFIFGPNPCGCGVRSNAVNLDGNIHFGEFSFVITTLLSGDFTMTFYLNLQSAGSVGMDLFSLGTECRRDSVFLVRYFPSADRITVRMSDQPRNEVELRGDTDPQRCWNYLAITKRGSVLKLYINNILVDEGASQSPMALRVDDNLSIANGPCLISTTNPDVRFMGRIDEIKFYNGELSQRAIAAADLLPDQIITRDTTIFLGESVPLVTGGSCTDQFMWSPVEGLSDPGLLEPIASPEVSTTYTLTINDDECTATDQVRINVVTSDELTCSDLRLPSAFTPNNDGINDIFGISNAFLIEDLTSFEIFNKWGGRVFFTDDFNETWDGVYKGSPAPPASYVYLVIYSCDGQSQKATGTVHIIR